MKSRISYVILLFISIFCFTGQVSALTGTVNVNDALYLRKSPSASGEILTYFYPGTVLNILSTNAKTDGDCTWYQVSYDKWTGYVCGTYVVLNNSTTPSQPSNSDTTDGYNSENYANPISKDGFIACYEDTGDVPLRTTAGGSTKTGAKLSCGVQVNVLETVEVGGNCKYWYKVNDGKNTGYICAYFVNTTKLSTYANNYYKNKTNGDTIANYQAKLDKAGFPSSYWPYLLEIHARHPSWIFEAEQLPMTFDAAVNGETTYGGSLLDGGGFDVGYLSTSSYSYNILQDRFIEQDGEDGWFNASKEAIAYYLDPRTYLNEKYIFAFETLRYKNNQSATVVKNFFSGTSIFPTPYKYYNSLTKNSSGLYSDGSTGDYAKDIVKACSDSEINISALHASSRIKLEMGTSGSGSSTGGAFTYCGKKYSGYYNFYNIGSYKTKCSNGDEMGSVASGLFNAYNKGWNTPYKSIKGGASFLANNYISLNQDTIYYEKFDVSTNNGHYDHQYQTNISAPVHEGGETYLGYVGSLPSYLNTAITFVIPVYKEMPNYAVVAPRLGNPNNYLSSLKIDGTSVSNFSYNTFGYNKAVSASTTSVKITATAINANAKISGTGTITLNSNTKVIPIKVTAQNGRTRTYNITITRNAATPTTVANLMKNSGYKYNNSTNYVFGINVGTNVNKIVANIISYNNSAEVKVTSSSGKVKTNASFATGDQVKVTGSDGHRTYTALIYGDVNGDGLIKSMDYIKIRNKITGRTKLTGVYLEAADVNKDGKVTSMDYVKVRNHITGASKITQ